ncbi:5271_t:CDS:2 [Paraglomus brasilianum]|uniref:5271_t:CDS:1 n=1 Tax=Paraglomus brasilianum TaxID=144538 RepID=A0A9N9CZS9_9GLOM|nr:5271_t:CDS:2 [Paraglomus brasilianum]
MAAQRIEDYLRISSPHGRSVIPAITPAKPPAARLPDTPPFIPPQSQQSTLEIGVIVSDNYFFQSIHSLAGGVARERKSPFAQLKDTEAAALNRYIRLRDKTPGTHPLQERKDKLKVQLRARKSIKFL